MHLGGCRVPRLLEPDFGPGGPRPYTQFYFSTGCPSAKNLLIVYRPLPQLGSRSRGVYGNQRVPSLMVLVLRKVWWGAGSASPLVHSTFWVAGLAGYGGLDLPILLTVLSVPLKGGVRG